MGEQDVQAITGKMATSMEVNMNLTPVTVMFANDASLASTLISAVLYLCVEVLGKAFVLAHILDKTANDEAARAEACRALETRIVYECIGEKLSIMTGPAIARLFLRAKNAAALETVVAAGLGYIAMEETTDALSTVVLARSEVHLTRVRPVFKARDAMFYGATVTINAGCIIMATMALGIDKH